MNSLKISNFSITINKSALYSVLLIFFLNGRKMGRAKRTYIIWQICIIFSANTASYEVPISFNFNEAINFHKFDPLVLEIVSVILSSGGQPGFWTFYRNISRKSHFSLSHRGTPFVKHKFSHIGKKDPKNTIS